MKLYYATGACSLAIRIIIAEIGVQCDYERVDLKTKKTAIGQDFLAINPKGAVPALMTDNNEILTENAVIQQYLAEHYHANTLLPPLDNFQRYRVLEWLNFISTDLHKSCGALFNATIPEDLKNTIFKPLLQKKLSHVEQSLKQTYLTGENFTLPDAYLFVILSWMPHLNVDISAFKNLQHYFTALKQRPSIAQALKEENLL